MKLKNQLIKAIENYVDTVMLPATYSAMVSVFLASCNGEIAPSEEEWNQLVLKEMKAVKEK